MNFSFGNGRKNLPPIEIWMHALWVAFLGGILFLPSVQMYEFQSFGNGVFSPFQTIWWPAASSFLALFLVLIGILLLRKKSLQNVSLYSPLILTWIAIFFWVMFAAVMRAPMGETDALSLSLLLQWLLAGSISFLIARNIVSTQVTITTLLIFGILQSLIAVYQSLPSFFFSADFDTGASVLRSSFGEILRASGTFAHPNILGFFLVVAFFLSSFASSSWRKWRFLLLIGIFFSFSRTAFLALLLGTILMNLNFLRKRRSHNLYCKILLPILILSIFGFLFRHFFDSFSPSNSERITQIFGSFYAIKEHFLFGIGTGNFATFFSQNQNVFPWQLQPVHNLFLLTASEWGMLSGIFFALFYLFLGKRSFILAQKHNAPALLGMFGTFFVFALFEHLLLTSFIGLLLLAIFSGILLRPLSEIYPEKQ